MVGTDSDSENQGFQKIVLKPNFIKAMDFAKGSYNSIYVEIKAEWKKVGQGEYEYKVVVHTNCEAQVILTTQKEIVQSGVHIFKVSR